MPYQLPLQSRRAIRYSSATGLADEVLGASAPHLRLRISREPGDADILDLPPPYSLHDPLAATPGNLPEYSEFDRVAERMREELVKAERLRLHCFYGELVYFTSRDVPIPQDAWQNIYKAYMLEKSSRRQNRASESAHDNLIRQNAVTHTDKYTRIIQAVSERLGIDHEITHSILLKHANRSEILRDDVAQMVAEKDWDSLAIQLRTDRLLTYDSVKIIDSESERNFLRLNIDRVVKAYLGNFPYGEHFMLRESGEVDRMYVGWRPYSRARH